MLRLFRWLALALVLPTAAAGAETITPLVEPAWLHQRLGASDLVVLDIRNRIDGGSREVYEAGHIPGAIYSDYLTAGWRSDVAGVPAQLPPLADLEALIGALGIGNEDHVVVVAGGVSALDMGSATRVYWTFKVLGHDRVSILNGGHRAYADAFPLERGSVTPSPTRFAASFRPELVATRDQVKDALQRGVTLVDNRPAAQYLGQEKHPAAARAGTIPGASSLPESELVADGRFRSGAELKALYSGAGIATEGETITFCNTGHWASLGWFAESELLGNRRTRLYDGSMVEWSGDASAPVEVKGAVKSATN